MDEGLMFAGRTDLEWLAMAAELETLKSSPPEGYVRLTASNGERNDVSIEVLENDVVPWKSIWQMLKKELGI